MYFCNFLEELEALPAFIDMERATPSTCVLSLKCIFIYFTSVPQLLKLILQPRYWIGRKAFHFPHQKRF
jgi:hypothetical protein